MSEYRFELRGIDRLLRKLDYKTLFNDPLRRFFNRATLKIVSRGKEQAPVQFGRLRGGIRNEVDSSSPPKWGKVGCNVAHRGFPYPKALDESDRYHYRGGGALGQTGRRTRGWFSERSVQASLSDIRGYLRDAEKDVKDIWDK